MTCLSIIQRVTGQLLLPQPTAVWSSTDPQVIQLRELLNEEGEELRKWPDHRWNKLVIEGTFNTVATNLQTSLPADFDYIIPMTIWNRTMNRQVWGPMDEQQWERELAGPTFTSPYYAYMFRGGQIFLTPVPAVGNAIFYEYVSTNWVYNSGSSTPNASAFSADSDTSVFPEPLVQRGLRWRYLRANGLDYSQEYDSWMSMLLREIARDGGAQRISASERYPWNRRTPFIPLGNWNV